LYYNLKYNLKARWQANSASGISFPGL